eukprot:1148190-Pelagomonas_calceolata.AAC.3
MEKLVDDGTVRDIGVSNFRVSDLDTLLASARIKVIIMAGAEPVINQVEANPYLQQPELKAFCDKNGECWMWCASEERLPKLGRHLMTPDLLRFHECKECF